MGQGTAPWGRQQPLGLGCRAETQSCPRAPDLAPFSRLRSARGQLLSEPGSRPAGANAGWDEGEPVAEGRGGGWPCLTPALWCRDLDQAADAAIEHKSESEMSLVLAKCSPAIDATVVEKLNRARAQILKK